MSPSEKNLQENKLGADWKIVSESIRKDIGEAAFQSWIKPIYIGELKKWHFRNICSYAVYERLG